MNENNAQHVRFAYDDGNTTTVLCTISYLCNDEYDKAYVLNELNKYFSPTTKLYGLSLEDLLCCYMRECVRHIVIVRPDNCGDECITVLVDSDDCHKIRIE